MTKYSALHQPLQNTVFKNFLFTAAMHRNSKLRSAKKGRPYGRYLLLISNFIAQNYLRRKGADCLYNSFCLGNTR